MIDEAERVIASATGPTPARLPRIRRGSRRIWLIGGVLALLLLVVLAGRLASPPAASAPPTAPSPGAPKLTARGEVRPVSQARIGTMAGGVLTRLVVQPGDLVVEGQEIARVRGTLETEVMELLCPARDLVMSSLDERR